MSCYTGLKLAIGLMVLVTANAWSASDSEQVEQGRRIYEQGLLPNNRPLIAQRQEGFTLEGEYGACTTCHRRSGMGSIEGQLQNVILVPPVAGPVLFAPARFANSFLDHSHHYIPNDAWARALTRPAYDDAKFVRALAYGIDSGGTRLSAPMPVYKLDEAASNALIAYLRQLNSQPTPGMSSDGHVHLATIITPDASPAQAEAVLSVVHAWVRSMRPLGRPMLLHEWRLSGNKQQWSQELATFYKEQPVFALLSGVGTTYWQPIHEFCGQNRLPCVLPALEAAPEDEENYYALYFSTGVTLEARLLAHHLQKQAPVPLVQIYADDTGQQAAKKLRAQATISNVVQQDRRINDSNSTTALSGISSQDNLVLWLRPAEIEKLAHWAPPPAKQIYLSALLAPPGSVHLPNEWKRSIAYISLFDDISVQNEIAQVRLRKWLQQRKVPVSDEVRWQADAYAACYLFNAALAKIRTQEVRRPAVPISGEQVLEMLETLVEKYSDGTEQVDTDSHVAFYGRMSLGPRQRIAVRGGSILRYSAPDYNTLIADGSRIVP